MTEVTRVPIQPIAKGSLTKIWVGVIIAVLLGASLAWAAVPKGFSIDTLVAGGGGRERKQPDTQPTKRTYGGFLF